MLGRRWLSVIPQNFLMRLSDVEIALSLRFRTLSPCLTPVCRACQQRDPTLFHAESCTATQRHRIGRHELVKYALGRALQTIPDSSITYEPLILNCAPGPARLNDVRFSGSSDLPPMEFDVKVTGLFTSQFTATRQPIPHDPDMTARTEAKMQHSLKRVPQQKIKALPAILIPGATFYPVIISSGGMIEEGTFQTMECLKKNLSVGSYSFMAQRISVGLARKRAAALANVEGIGGSGSGAVS